jgi:26S proteasome regulatory subunit N7
MAPFYAQVAEQLKWDVDQALLEKMKEENTTKLKQLDDAIKDATENLGESEVRDALLAKAVYYTRIGDKVTYTSCLQLWINPIKGKCRISIPPYF